MTETGGRGAEQAPRSLEDLWLLRTDYEDVPVASLGGETLRVYALTGTARAVLMAEMSQLAKYTDDLAAVKDPAIVRQVLMFQGRVVGAALGYPVEQWEQVGSVLSAPTIEDLYDVAARLSGLGADEQAKAKARLRRKRSVASGTG